jgi:uncharacterized protein YggE
MTTRRLAPPPLAVLLSGVLAVLLSGLLAVAVTGCAGAAGADDPPARLPTITGHATGSVDGVPDTLTVTLGVDSRAGSAQEAMARNAARATGVINALKVSGVAPKDLQTTQLSVFPTFDDRGRITGYHVANVVTARLHDMAAAGAVIDAAAGQAGDDIRVQGIDLSIEDTGALMAAARADAVRSARTQARQLARAAGVRLGALQRVTERRAGGVPFPAGLRAADQSAARTPIEPGSEALTVDVTVVYEIAPG